MSKSEKMMDNLNRGLHKVFAENDDVFMIGEDIRDPYGGAFKTVRGLHAKYPERVISTPISEQGFLGLAGGLSLFGQKPIVELMHGDFIALGFDQILNWASKSVTMYGMKLDLNMVIRCPTGAGRGSGPTHCQSLQKHFVGIPNLDLFEMTPFHDNLEMWPRMISLGHPCIYFEDRILYSQNLFTGGKAGDLFNYEFVGKEKDYARVFAPQFKSNACVIIAPGGMSLRVMEAAKKLYAEQKIECQILVPTRLYPFDVTPIEAIVRSADYIFVVEESIAGGLWGGEVAERIYEKAWADLRNRVHLISSKNSIIPSTIQLEKEVVVQTEDIARIIAREISKSGTSSKKAA